MRRSIPTFALVTLMTVSCESNPHPAAEDPRIAAARELTKRYAASRLAKWELDAHAAGHDCDVLFIETSMLLENALVETLHYGAGDYGVVPGGVHSFSRASSFRGTAYRDRSGHIWTFGKVTRAEAASMNACR